MNRKNLIMRKKASRLVIARTRAFVEKHKTFNKALHNSILNYSRLASEKALLKYGIIAKPQDLDELANDLIIHSLEHKHLIIYNYNKYFRDDTLKDRENKVKYDLKLYIATTRAFFYFTSKKLARSDIARMYYKMIGKGITQTSDLVETSTLDSIDYRMAIDLDAQAIQSVIELFESLNNTEKNNLIKYFKIQNDNTASKYKKYNALRKIKDIKALKSISQDIFIQTLEYFQSLAMIYDYIA